MYKITPLDDKARWNHIKQAHKFYAVLERSPNKSPPVCMNEI